MTEATATTAKRNAKITGTRWPADSITKLPIDELIPYARNARTHSDDQVSQIAASMKQWGWTNPVLIDEDKMIIAGHGRVLAAQRLGFKDIPCMVAKDWTETQKKAYVIADNKLALNAGWDNKLLALELEDILHADFDVELTGFLESEVTELMFDGNFEPGGEDEQGALDEAKEVTCPNCGEAFSPKA